MKMKTLAKLLLIFGLLITPALAKEANEKVLIFKSNSRLWDLGKNLEKFQNDIQNFLDNGWTVKKEDNILTRTNHIIIIFVLSPPEKNEHISSRP